MPTYPESNSETKTHISGYALDRLGWSKSGFTWTKGENCITYNGAVWRLNGIIVQFVENIKRVE